ncbi:hypothetical protein CMI37_00050, partial [Candidatus Pacearchaeota archaeon]|nr:hypothetical protein [Candidatus Pacearchaeota archaeon]
NLAGTGGANTVTVAVTNNQAVSSVTNTVTNNQAVSVTGSISNTSLTEAQLASHTHTKAAATDYQGGPVDHSDPRTTVWAQNNPTGSTGSGTGHTHAHTLAGTLTGTVAVASSGGALSGTVTAAGNNTFSPYVVVNYIIKH